MKSFDYSTTYKKYDINIVSSYIPTGDEYDLLDIWISITGKIFRFDYNASFTSLENKNLWMEDRDVREEYDTDSFNNIIDQVIVHFIKRMSTHYGISIYLSDKHDKLAVFSSQSFEKIREIELDYKLANIYPDLPLNNLPMLYSFIDLFVENS